MNALAGILKDPKSRKAMSQVAQAALIAAPATSPVVKTIQVAWDILRADPADRASLVTDTLVDAVPKMAGIANSLRSAAPVMHVVTKSFCDSAVLFSSFGTVAIAMGVAANLIETYHGVKALERIAASLEGINTTLMAQTALLAQEKFPALVYNMLLERIQTTHDDDACDHRFFLYHTDNDWYPEFYRLLERKPLGPKFCGYTYQLDTVFAFMLAARERLNVKGKKSKSKTPVKFHLIIPAYQPMVVAEPVRIPDGLGDFVIEGRINSARELVWFNLPAEQRKYLSNVGLYVPPPQTWWDWGLSKTGMGPKPVRGCRVLGTGKMRLALPDASSVEAGGVEEPENTECSPQRRANRQHAAPLHSRRRSPAKALTQGST